MGFATGLKKIQEATAPKSNGEGFANRLKVDDGQQILFRIINEFDEDSKEYDEERGLAGVVEQHQSPSAWYKKAQCTMDEYGKCYACERSKHYWSIKDEKNAKAWRAKQRLYFNVIAKNEDGEDTVYFYDVATFRSPVYESLMEHFMDYGSVSNKLWKLKRKGGGQFDTTYTLTAQPEDKTPYEWPADLKPYALDDLVPYVPYEEQEAFYGAGAAEEPVEDSSPVDENAWL